MNLLFRVLYAHGCRSTHHKLAMDALCHLAGPRAEGWRAAFLDQHAAYLSGAKAPDDQFKDFRNHVLHVGEHFWGGAPQAATKWYALTVVALRARDWKTAAFNAGVLSHYYTDPIMPFHTAQSKSENNIHRAFEWSVTKSYDAMKPKMGAPAVAVPATSDWLAEMVRDGARRANPAYQTLIDRYDFARGVKDPPAGLDDVSRDLLAHLLGFAAVGFARILERALAEAAVEPPAVSLTLAGFLAALQVPVKWVTNKMADAKERAAVEAMYQEFATTGRVERRLPEDDRAVAALHRAEVLAAPAPAPVVIPIAKPTPTPTLRFFLSPDDPVVESPSIGPKTAARLNAVGVRTVADLIGRDATALAAEIGARHLSAVTLRDWQDQARLMCRVPEIRGHDAAILVACGYRTPEAVASANAAELLSAASGYAATTDGLRLLRGGDPPDADEVGDWIRWAGQARPLAKAG